MFQGKVAKIPGVALPSPLILKMIGQWDLMPIYKFHLSSVEAVKNTTLCKLHKRTKGFRPMQSNADQDGVEDHT